MSLVVTVRDTRRVFVDRDGAEHQVWTVIDNDLRVGFVTLDVEGVKCGYVRTDRRIDDGSGLSAHLGFPYTEAPWVDMDDVAAYVAAAYDVFSDAVSTGWIQSQFAATHGIEKGDGREEQALRLSDVDNGSFYYVGFLAGWDLYVAGLSPDGP